MDQKDIIKGRFHAVLFRNEESSYQVRKFKLIDEDEKMMTVTGYYPDLPKDVNFRLYGYYQEHSRYGMQFVLESFERMELDDTEALIAYFSSAIFEGIGKKMATELVDTLGTDIINVIRDNPDCLDSINKMTTKKKLAILSGLEQREDNEEEALRYFTLHGLQMRQAMKLQAVYGKNMKEVILSNPYRMVEDVDGIGFQTADKLAAALGFELDNPYRTQAACVSLVMQLCMQSGNSYVTIEELETAMSKQLRDINFDFSDIVHELRFSRKIVIEDNRVYHVSQYDAECYIGSYLAEFPMHGLDEVANEDVQKHIELVQSEYGIEYQKEQLRAINEFFTNDVLIMTGGPGTGKTTVVRAMVNLSRRLYPQASIALCAPTGRAAKRLSELTNYTATTIHSLLNWNLETNSFGRNEDSPLNVDILIVDEFSMVDQWLLYNLFKAGKNIRKIIFIGDEDQLPSVSPGCVLKDLLEVGCFSFVRLEKIFRQQEGSDIITLAHDIKNDECSEIPSFNDVKFITCNQYDAKSYILQLVLEAVNRGYELSEIQVLAPQYSGVAGIDALNVALQKVCNPPDENKRELKVGYRTFREHDKILQLKNQPDDNVFNGDIGTLVEIIYANETENKRNVMIVEFDGIYVEYNPDFFAHITHAYCISVHKSQGSEYPIVIMPVLQEFRMMLQKRLIYTGITRAKKSLVLLGQQEAFLKGIHTVDQRVRLTMLQKRILESKALLEKFL